MAAAEKGGAERPDAADAAALSVCLSVVAASLLCVVMFLPPQHGRSSSACPCAHTSLQTLQLRPVGSAVVGSDSDRAASRADPPGSASVCRCDGSIAATAAVGRGRGRRGKKKEGEARWLAEGKWQRSQWAAASGQRAMGAAEEQKEPKEKEKGRRASWVNQSAERENRDRTAARDG